MDEIMNFAMLMVAPVCIVYMPAYIAMVVVMFLAVLRKRFLPRYAAFLNPAIIIMVVHIMTFFGGNNEIAHSLQMANRGLGSVITFGRVYLLYRKQIQ